jgi:outer membrane assembly lipoprotein YfiO
MTSHGTTKYVLAIPYSTAEDGIQRMRRTLQQYPNEDFSPQYALWLADFLLANEKIEEAQADYLFIVTQYDKHPVVAVALYKLGECELTRYHGIRFDTRPLTEADKYYVRVLDEFPRSAMANSAEQRRRYVHEQLASKEYENGRFYEGKGYDKSAATYYRNILTRYPKTSFAPKARERLLGMGLPVEDGK